MPQYESISTPDLVAEECLCNSPTRRKVVHNLEIENALGTRQDGRRTGGSGWEEVEASLRDGERW